MNHSQDKGESGAEGGGQTVALAQFGKVDQATEAPDAT
jgi:hypothetical protein